MERCAWATTPLLTSYHDKEWGVPVHDDQRLFEFLVLEGAQAGLSWETVLKKRPCYREVFDGFDPAVVARYDAEKIASLLADPGIIRNDSFDAYLWLFVDGRPVKTQGDERITRTEVSDALSKDLLKRGFRFVGTIICYALMQAVGMVNDHEAGCFRRAEIGGRRTRTTRGDVASCPSHDVRRPTLRVPPAHPALQTRRRPPG